MNTINFTIFSSLFFLFFANPGFTQGPEFDWATKIDYGNGYSITADSLGNAYTTGIKSGIIFIQKQDITGEVIWIKEMGIGNASGQSIKTDKLGNVFITGFFRDSVDFDPGPDSLVYTAVGDYNAFVLKLNTIGNLIWAKQFKGSNNNSSSAARSIDLDSEGDLLITGSFGGIVDFNPGIDTFSQIAPYGTKADIFVCKLNMSGEFVWAKSMGGNRMDGGNAITVDEFDNVYTVGYFNGATDFAEAPVDFDPGPGVFNIEAVGQSDIFIQKLDPNGGFVWALSMGGNSDDTPIDIVLDQYGNIHTTGNFLGISDFDPGPGVYNLIAGTVNGGSKTGFYSKLSPNGEFIWAKQLELKCDSDGFTLDEYGNVYGIGGFSYTKDFDPGPGVANMTAVGNQDTYILKLDPDGEYLWALQFGGTNCHGRSIYVDDYLRIYSTGNFNNITDFDPGPDVFNLNAVSGERSIFIQKLKQCDVISNITSNSGFEICEGEFLTLTASGGNNYLWNTGDTTFSISVSPLTNTVFSVEISDSLDCTANEAVEIIVHTLPEAQFDFYIDGSSVEFMNQSDSTAQSFEWNFGDNSTSFEIDPSHTYLESGVYTVQLISFNDCGSDTISEEIEVIFTSTKNIGEEPQVQLNPNPTTGIITIHLPGNLANAKLEIKNYAGKSVMKQHLKNDTTIDLTDFASGVYFIQIQVGDALWMEKVVKL